MKERDQQKIRSCASNSNSSVSSVKSFWQPSHLPTTGMRDVRLPLHFASIEREREHERRERRERRGDERTRETERAR